MISAKVIQHSRSQCGVEIFTLELEYPRFIHSEFMTHRVFSRNAASSRAIPIETMMQQVVDNPAMPVYWGANQSGMQARKEVRYPEQAERAWVMASRAAIQSAMNLRAHGLHKQIVNRVLEPFQMMKTVVTSTEWDNFFSLRMHEDAQPEIHALAIAMCKAMQESTPITLREDEWHVPYVDRSYDTYNEIVYSTEGEQISLQDALKISASCCAQVSYRKNDVSLEKAIAIYDKLITGKPIHASPFEHQASPLLGKTVFSGNFRGWMPYRKVIGE